MLSKFLILWRELIRLANTKGIPLPTVRDPKTGIGSVSLTLVVLSSGTVLLGLLGKWSRHLGDVDINNALQFFYASSALYFSRNISTKIGTISNEEKSSKE